MTYQEVMNESYATQHCVSNGERGVSNTEDRESRIEWKPYWLRKEQSSTCQEEEELTKGFTGKQKSVSDSEESTTFVADYLKNGKKRKRCAVLSGHCLNIDPLHYLW